MNDTRSTKHKKTNFQQEEEFLTNELVKKIRLKLDAFKLNDFTVLKGIFFFTDSVQIRADIEIHHGSKSVALIEIDKEIDSEDDVKRKYSSIISNLYKSIDSLSFFYIYNGVNFFLYDKKAESLLTMQTDEAIDALVQYCYEKFGKDQQERMIANDSINQKLDSLRKRLDKLQKRLIALGTSKEPNVEKLKKEYQSSINDINEQIEELEATSNKHEEGQEIELRWSTRIKESFEILNEKTRSLVVQKYLSRGEWIFWIVMILVALVLFVIWCFWFENHISVESTIKIDNYYTLFPKIMPLPIFIGLLWVFVVQKNKARRIEITISTMLFNIKYLEGLLMMVQKLSKNNDNAIEHINDFLQDIVHQYIVQIGKKDVTTESINKISDEEEKENPLIKNMSDIKNVISNGK